MRFTLAAVLMLCACGPSSPPVNGPQTAQSSGAGSGSNLSCHEETPLGSSISRTVCTDPNAGPQMQTGDLQSQGVQNKTGH